MYGRKKDETMTCRGIREFANGCRAVCSFSFFLALAACSYDVGGSAVTAPPISVGYDKVAQPLPSPDASGELDAGTVLFDIQAEIRLRNEEYDAVVRKAQMRGLVGGALQGGLLGILMTGAPEGAIVGGVTGGALGYWVSGKAATQLVEEHRNFLIRKWSIETVMKAALTDTENTRFDLLLSRRALEATRSETRVPIMIGDQEIAHLSEFRDRAEGRALVLHEVIPIFANDPDASDRLSELLKEQVTMLGDMRKTIEKIAKNHD